MKSFIKIGAVVTLVVLFASCQDKSKPNYQYMPNMYEAVGYETYQPVEFLPDGIEAQLPVAGTINRGWLPYEFENTLEESLDLKLHFGHIRGFQFKEIALEVEITTPDNKKEIIPVNLKLIDETGKDLGDCTGDICDVFQTIKTFDTLQSGKYIVTVKSKFAGPYLPNVLGVGITIEKRL